MNAATAIDFAHPHHRKRTTALQVQDGPQDSAPASAPSVFEPIKPMTEDIAKDALRVSTLYGNTVKERNDFAQKLNETTARLEQAEIKISEQRSTIESLTAELSAERTEKDNERAERIRLGQVVEGIIHSAQRAIEQPGQRENEQD